MGLPYDIWPRPTACQRNSGARPLRESSVAALRGAVRVVFRRPPPPTASQTDTDERQSRCTVVVAYCGDRRQLHPHCFANSCLRLSSQSIIAHLFALPALPQNTRRVCARQAAPCGDLQPKATSRNPPLSILATQILNKGGIV